MGLTRKNKNVSFLNISKDKFVQRVAEPTDTSVTRTLTMGVNQGKEVHEEKYDEVEGCFIGIFKKTSDVSFQKEPLETLEVILKDDEGLIFQISMNFSSSYTRGIMTRVEALDLKKPVEIGAYWIKGDDGKERGFIGMKQNGKKINPIYSRNSEGDSMLPKVESQKVGKKIIHDDSVLLEFYEKIILKMDAKLGASAPVDEKKSEYKGLSITNQEGVYADENGEEITKDDLPF